PSVLLISGLNVQDDRLSSAVRFAIAPAGSAGNASLRQRFLEPIHAGACGCLRRATSAPVGFETQPVVEAITLQSLKLPNPIHNTAANRSPIVFVVRLVRYVFAVAVSNALFRQQLIAGWIGRTPDGHRIARVPVQHEVLVWNPLQHSSRLFARGCVAGHLIFQEEDEVVFGAAFRSL